MYNKYKIQLVERLSNLYLALIGNAKGNHVDVKTLWRWIKYLVANIKNSKFDADKEIKTGDLFKEKPESDAEKYKEYCLKIIKEHNLKNLAELKAFINRLLDKNSKNKRRVERIKKLLLTGKIFIYVKNRKQLNITTLTSLNINTI